MKKKREEEVLFKIKLVFVLIWYKKRLYVIGFKIVFTC